MKRSLPDLSRFEIQCLRRLWVRGEATARDILEDLSDPPTYSTVRKILERLEDKGAVARVRMDGKAVVYRSLVTPSAMIRKEIGRFLDTLFDGCAAPLVAHLADMRAVSMEDLHELEAQLGERSDTEPAEESAAAGPDSSERHGS